MLLYYLEAKHKILGRGGGQVVSMLAFYSDDPSPNPAEILNFYSLQLFEKSENKSKGVAHF